MCPCDQCIMEKRFHVRGEADGAVYRKKPVPQEQQFANTDGAALKAVKNGVSPAFTPVVSPST